MSVIDLTDEPRQYEAIATLLAQCQADQEGVWLTPQRLARAREGVCRALTVNHARARPRVYGKVVDGELRAVLICRNHLNGTGHFCAEGRTAFSYRCHGYQRELLACAMNELRADCVRVLVPPSASATAALEHLSFDLLEYVSVSRVISWGDIVARRLQAKTGTDDRFGKDRNYRVSPAVCSELREIVQIQQHLALTVPVNAEPQEVYGLVAHAIQNPDLFVLGQYYSLYRDDELIGVGKVFLEFSEVDCRWVMFLRNFVLASEYRGCGLIGPFLDRVMSMALAQLQDEMLPANTDVIGWSFLPPEQPKVLAAFARAGFVESPERLAEYRLVVPERLAYQI